MHKRIWAYKDGSRDDASFQCAGKHEGKRPQPYKEGDVIGENHVSVGLIVMVQAFC